MQDVVVTPGKVPESVTIETPFMIELTVVNNKTEALYLELCLDLDLNGPIVHCGGLLVCCSVLQSVAVCCSVCLYLELCLDLDLNGLTVHSGGLCCSVLQCVAVCCSVLQCVAVCCSVLQCVAVCCSVLQCVAVYCSVLQCVAVCVLSYTVEVCLHHQRQKEREGEIGRERTRERERARERVSESARAGERERERERKRTNEREREKEQHRERRRQPRAYRCRAYRWHCATMHLVPCSSARASDIGHIVKRLKSRMYTGIIRVARGRKSHRARGSTVCCSLLQCVAAFTT